MLYTSRRKGGARSLQTCRVSCVGVLQRFTMHVTIYLWKGGTIAYG